MLREVIDLVGIPRGKDPELLDRNVLLEMNEQQFKELIVRFSSALADATDPAKQADLLNKCIEQWRFFAPGGYFKCLLLGEDVEWERYFDEGARPAFRQLELAHEKVLEFVKEADRRFFSNVIRPGRVIQEDSRRVLGIQAADIAAGIAAGLYEQSPGDRRSGARRVRGAFNRVLHNSQWIEK
jgi:hypothetical protein